MVEQQQHESELTTISKVLHYFDLPTLDGTPIVLKDGIANHNYLVKTVDNKNYVVKFLINPAITIESLENERSVQQQLREGGLDTISFLINASGSYLYEVDGVRAVVSEKIFGVHPWLLDESFLFELGVTLGHFHTKVKDLPNDHRNWLDFTVAEENMRLISDTELMGSLSKAKEYVSQGGQLFKSNLPIGVVHADLWESNILVEPVTQKITALLDFEETQKMALIIDIARTIIDMCRTEDAKGINKKLVNAMLEGYEKVRKLEEKEMELLPLAIRYVAGAGTLWFLANKFNREFAVEFMKRAENFL